MARRIAYDAKRRAIVQSAQQILRDEGYSAATVERVIVVAGILTFAVSLNNFALIWVTTQGGPGNQTQVASTLIYTRAFVLQELGAASALAIVLGIIVLAIAGAISRLSGDS